MKRLSNDKGASFALYLFLISMIAAAILAGVKLIVSNSQADGCDFNYGVSDGNVHLRMEGYGCMRSTINAVGEDTNVILSVDPEDNSGIVQASFPAGTVYSFTIHYIDSDGQDITRQIEDVREGDSESFST